MVCWIPARTLPEDFDALADFGEFAKRQFARKAGAPLSPLAVQMVQILSGKTPPRFTVSEAITFVGTKSEDVQMEFPEAWNELLRASRVVVISSKEPKIYSLKENA